MLSIFRKKEPTTISLELNKSYILSSVVDKFKNELLFPGSISVNLQGIEDKSSVTWTLFDNATGNIYGSYSGEMILKDIPVGEYKIVFDQVYKNITPLPQTKILNEREIIVFVGSYVRSTGDLSVIIDSNLKTFNKELATWTLSGNSNGYYLASNGNKTITDLDASTYTMVFDTVENFSTPEPIIVGVESNKSKSLVGIYTTSCSGSLTGSLTGTLTGSVTACDNRDMQLFFGFNNDNSPGTDISNVRYKLKNNTTGCEKRFVGQVLIEPILGNNFLFPSGNIGVTFENFNIEDYYDDIFMSIDNVRYYRGEYDLTSIDTVSGNLLVLVIMIGSNAGVRPQ